VPPFFAQQSIARTPPKSSEWLGKSHAIQIEWLAALRCRLFDEGAQFGARSRLVDDLLPAIIIHLRELAQLLEYGLSLCLTKFWQFIDDFRCAHGEIIAFGPHARQNLLVVEDFIEARLFSQLGNILIFVFFDDRVAA